LVFGILVVKFKHFRKQLLNTRKENMSFNYLSTMPRLMREWTLGFTHLTSTLCSHQW